jgi:hypothetical protein
MLFYLKTGGSKSRLKGGTRSHCWRDNEARPNSRLRFRLRSDLLPSPLRQGCGATKCFDTDQAITSTESKVPTGLLFSLPETEQKECQSIVTMFLRAVGGDHKIIDNFRNCPLKVSFGTVLEHSSI